jgi:hypothetical protein
MTSATRKAVKKESKKRYLARRMKRVRELYLRDGLEPRDIAAELVKDGTIETTDESFESAIRLVRGDVAKIRAEIDGRRAADSEKKVAINEIDALERELAELRKAHADQKLIAAGEPTEMCARSRYPIIACTNPDCLATGKHFPFVAPAIGVTMTDTPQGMMTSYRALWPAGVRQKASKDAAILAEKISKLEIVLSEKRRAPMQPGKGEDDGPGDGLFQIVTSGKPMNDLIATNVDKSKVN